jgi:hypothetical protein
MAIGAFGQPVAGRRVYQTLPLELKKEGYPLIFSQTWQDATGEDVIQATLI